MPFQFYFGFIDIHFGQDGINFTASVKRTIKENRQLIHAESWNIKNCFSGQRNFLKIYRNWDLHNFLYDQHDLLVFKFCSSILILWEKQNFDEIRWFSNSKEKTFSNIRSVFWLSSIRRHMLKKIFLDYTNFTQIHIGSIFRSFFVFMLLRYFSCFIT